MSGNPPIRLGKQRPRPYLKPRFGGHPEPGWFRLKQIRGGPWVPALIWMPCPWVDPEPLEEIADPPEYWCLPTEPARYLRATIGEEAADPLDVWLWGRDISPAEYRWRMALLKWAARESPAAPEANPRQRVNLSRQPSLF